MSERISRKSLINSRNKEEDGLARLFLMTFFHINDVRNRKKGEIYGKYMELFWYGRKALLVQ